MRSLLKVSVIFLIIAALISLTAVAQDQVFRWTSISGKWELRKDNKTTFLLESKAKTYSSGYSELINYNSLITQDAISDPSSIQFTFSLMSPVSFTENLFVFNAENFRTFYAIKLEGDGKKITKTSLISSKINDTTLKPSIKNNYTISEIAAKGCSMDYNADYKSEISINKRKKSITFSVNGKEALSAKLPEEISAGKIGFSNRNAILKISNLKIFSDKKLVFEEDFSTDTIKRLKVTAKKISETEDEKENK